MDEDIQKKLCGVFEKNLDSFAEKVAAKLDNRLSVISRQLKDKDDRIKELESDVAKLRLNLFDKYHWPYRLSIIKCTQRNTHRTCIYLHDRQ